MSPVDPRGRRVRPLKIVPMSAAYRLVSVTSALLLLVGSIGIATLMVLVAKQRRPEIGLRRALGATPIDIAFQFLLEGLVLASSGVLIGLVIGIGGSIIIPYAFSMPAATNYRFALLGVLVSLGTTTVVATGTLSTGTAGTCHPVAERRRDQRPPHPRRGPPRWRRARRRFLPGAGWNGAGAWRNAARA